MPRFLHWRLNLFLCHAQELLKDLYEQEQEVWEDISSLGLAT